MNSITFKVRDTFSLVHNQKIPGYALDKHVLSEAVSDDGVRSIFVLANPALKPGDKIAGSDIECLPNNSGYYLLTSFAQNSSASASVLTKAKKTYQPDVFDPEKLWKAHKGFEF